MEVHDFLPKRIRRRNLRTDNKPLFVCAYCDRKREDPVHASVDGAD